MADDKHVQFFSKKKLNKINYKNGTLRLNENFNKFVTDPKPHSMNGFWKKMDNCKQF